MSREFKHQIKFLIATLLVVIMGGYVWGWVGLALYIETGFFAIAIGFLSGFTASLYFERENGWIYPTVASWYALLGIFIGKYILFAYYAAELFVEAEASKFEIAGKALLTLNGKNLKGYIEYSSETLNFYDLVWAILAIITANVNARRVRKYKLALYRFKQKIKKGIFGKS